MISLLAKYTNIRTVLHHLGHLCPLIEVLTSNSKCFSLTLSYKFVCKPIPIVKSPWLAAAAVKHAGGMSHVGNSIAKNSTMWTWWPLCTNTWLLVTEATSHGRLFDLPVVTFLARAISQVMDRFNSILETQRDRIMCMIARLFIF